jgi:hypothetical protein
MFAPLEGWHHIKVTDRCAAMDYAQSSTTLFPRAVSSEKYFILILRQ